MGEPKTSAHIKIMIKMQNLSQEPPASSIAPNQDLDDLCTFKIILDSRNSELVYRTPLTHDFGILKDFKLF